MIPILFREELKEYDFGAGHPFRGDRFELFPKILSENLHKKDYKIIESGAAEDEDLLLICDKDYIQFAKKYYKNDMKFYPDFYKFFSEDNRPREKHGRLEEAARLIVGQAKMGVDMIQKGKFEKVVSIGGGLHHAKPDYGEGFCIYNDVAFAAKYLMKKYDINKILILDTDAHAGNGTSEYFYRDDSVLLIDLHQDPRTIYPGTGFADEIGEGKGKGYTINVPMPVYAGDKSYKLIFDEIIEPVTRQFKPEIIIRNGGSDPYFGDELTNLGLSIKGFRMIGEQVRRLSKISNGKVLDLILSGYSKNLLLGWMALISGLADIKTKKEFFQEPQKDLVIEKTERVVDDVKRNLKDYWNF